VPAELHAGLGRAVVLYLTVVGLWGIGLAATDHGPSASFRGALVIAEITVVVQGILGLLSWVSSSAPDAIHVLYGAALVLTLPLVASTIRDASPRRASLALGLAAFFAAGLAVRGITTG
jgi:hypothetical protein